MKRVEKQYTSYLFGITVKENKCFSFSRPATQPLHEVRLYSHHFKQRPESPKVYEDSKESKDRILKNWNGKDFSKPTKPPQDFDGDPFPGTS